VLRATLIRAGSSPLLKRQASANPLARRVAGRFIAGDTLDQATEAVESLNARGLTVALDFLGENTTSAAEARGSADAYLAALARIRERGLAANVTVKLTAMGLDLDPDLAVEQAGRVLAGADGTMVGIDMEAGTYVDRTLDVVDRLRGSVPTGGLGLCLQAYLYRTPADLDRCNGWDVPVRLVKGAYDESPSIAYPSKVDVDRAYGELLEKLMRSNPYPMVATHDPGMVVKAKRLAASAGRSRDSFEFQFLYGIRRDLQAALVAEGYRVRVYVPYGRQWYPYFMRRLAERPANLGFFLSSLTRR
jgi:proline dehydrogenase